jgi:hypothetical protein
MVRDVSAYSARPALYAAGSLGLFVVLTGLVLAASGKTLGYDYLCYEGAARALTEGRPIYDNAFSIQVGTCPGTYTYPPPFAVALIPWLLLGGAAAGAWCLAMAACFLLGVALLPVSFRTRSLLLVVAAFDWPLLYAIKLGQVGPILFLLFAATWRWMDRAPVLGAATAVGAMVKVQPGLVAIWALATRRYRAFALAACAAAVLAAAAMPLTTFGAWGDYVDLVRGLGGTFSTPHDFAPGAVAHLAGASEAAATAVQLASAALALAALLAAWRFGSPGLGLQATFVASQLLSAPLRDHYAMLLLLPTAWLLERGRKWSVVFPLSGWLSIAAFPAASGSATGAATAPIQVASWPAAATIPLAFFACLAVLLAEAHLERRSATRALTTEPVRAMGESV